MIEFNSQYPVLVAENLPALKAFYMSYFGFDTVFFDKSFYLHLVHPNGTELGFLMPNLDSQPDFLHAHPSKEGMVLTFEVANADVASTLAKKEGLDFAMELKEESWGQNHFMLRDPAGNIIDVVQQLK